MARLSMTNLDTQIYAFIRDAKASDLERRLRTPIYRRRCNIIDIEHNLWQG